MFTLKNKKIDLKKINFLKFSKYLYSITILIILLIISWVLFFLYNNVYLVMIQAETVTELKIKTISETIQTEKMNQIISKIEEKTTYFNNKIKEIANPFDSDRPIVNEESVSLETTGETATTTATTTNETTDPLGSEATVETKVEN